MLELIQENSWILAAIAIWVLPWKGVALWKAARLGQKVWFIAILVVNTLALLEIFYIFVIARKKTVEIAKAEK
ncbi:hypothetical protein KKB69_00370 [Patescibacteria group bacterium]|nr:hypothetical protein [Patescibacteria group bacterium]